MSGGESETNRASRPDLPHLTRRELLSHRAKLERAVARGRITEAGTALLARIEGELETRRTLRFENAAKDVPPLFRGMRDEDV
jgi:hypothetical protein